MASDLTFSGLFHACLDLLQQGFISLNTFMNSAADSYVFHIWLLPLHFLKDSFNVIQPKIVEVNMMKQYTD